MSSASFYKWRSKFGGMDASLIYDNAMAESINSLSKTKVIHKDRPWRGLDDVERKTLIWAGWFNNRRILQGISDMLLVEYELIYRQNPELRKVS